MCFFDPQITLNEITRHELIADLVITEESSKRNFTHRGTLYDTSSRKSVTTTTSKVLRRYLTSGTHEGSSSEYTSEVNSGLNSNIDKFKRTQKIQSVMYEDSSFILKKLLSHGQRKSKVRSPTEKISGNSLQKNLKPNSIVESSSQSSSSPSTFSRNIDRSNEKNRVIMNDNYLQINTKPAPIYEEILEEERSKHLYILPFYRL